MDNYNFKENYALNNYYVKNLRIDSNLSKERSNTKLSLRKIKTMNNIFKSKIYYNYKFPSLNSNEIKMINLEIDIDKLKLTSDILNYQHSDSEEDFLKFLINLLNSNNLDYIKYGVYRLRIFTEFNSFDLNIHYINYYRNIIIFIVLAIEKYFSEYELIFESFLVFINFIYNDKLELSHFYEYFCSEKLINFYIKILNHLSIEHTAYKSNNNNNNNNNNNYVVTDDFKSNLDSNKTTKYSNLNAYLSLSNNVIILINNLLIKYYKITELILHTEIINYLFLLYDNINDEEFTYRIVECFINLLKNKDVLEKNLIVKITNLLLNLEFKEETAVLHISCIEYICKSLDKDNDKDLFKFIYFKKIDKLYSECIGIYDYKKELNLRNKIITYNINEYADNSQYNIFHNSILSYLCIIGSICNAIDDFDVGLKLIHELDTLNLLEFLLKNEYFKELHHYCIWILYNMSCDSKECKFFILNHKVFDTILDILKTVFSLENGNQQLCQEIAYIIGLQLSDNQYDSKIIDIIVNKKIIEIINKFLIRIVLSIKDEIKNIDEENLEMYLNDKGLSLLFRLFLKYLNDCFIINDASYISDLNLKIIFIKNEGLKALELIENNIFDENVLNQIQIIKNMYLLDYIN